MAKNKLKLNDPFIRNHPAPENRIEIYDTYVSGLAVRITPTGHKSFVYRYRFNDKVKRFTIGSYPKMSLAEAREEVGELAYQVSRGTDPLVEKKKRKHQPESKNFEQLAKKYKQRHVPTLRAGSQKEYNRIINNELLPEFKGMKVSDITKHHIRNKLDDKAYGTNSQKPVPTMANRIRAVLSSMFDFGIKKVGLTIERNPVLDTPTYEEGKKRRDRFYSEDEIKALWNAFEQEAEPIQSVLKMLLLTAQRKTETMNMRWSNIQKDVWTIPSEITKNKQSHQVPLSNMALQIIEDIKPITGESDYVFESPRLENEPIGWIKQAVDRIRDVSKVRDFRIHDLRRTAATNMAKLGIDPMVIGKVLNHKELAQEHRITAIYNRHDYMEKKEQALNQWNHKLEQVLEGKTSKIAGTIGK